MIVYINVLFTKGGGETLYMGGPGRVRVPAYTIMETVYYPPYIYMVRMRNLLARFLLCPHILTTYPVLTVGGDERSVTSTTTDALEL